ncbi:disease resistance protein RUN1-like [Rosa chinensis]|uniref:disease resistance protein RUN1-like n=1 Tax=Rosa chinensis TaxID=74649 RepID=UPI000D095461|nr:disease resistance protein RUN1-like [Rosa chinensis]
MATDSSSSSSSSHSSKYDVFISFRGPDTRQSFVGHLHRALERKALTAFIDTEELEKGQLLQVLLKAIDDSKLSVVVFSENYASSSWCLKELARIVERMDSKQQIVVPIFYKVPAAHVRYQKGSFEEAFAEHENRGSQSNEVLGRWKLALTRAADLDGWDSSNYKDDAHLIELVVEDIFKKLIKTRSSESEYLVGMEYHMQQLEILLHPKSNDVRIVGIWGMGGLGKTTIARAAYDKFTFNFDACCFLENVGKTFKAKGQGQMQEVLLFKILKDRVQNLGTSSMASEMVVQMLSKKKLFLVLDDVDNFAQVEALLGNYRSFTGGSRIIITTRDRQSLSKSVMIYRPKFLDYKEALELFRKYAKPSEEYDDLLSTALEYAKGLPLAVKVLGASVRDKSISEWKDEFRRIKKYQDQGIEGVLRTSFDGLEESRQKLFLDVACFFRGIKKDYATLILDACDLFPISGLRVLADRGLVTTSGNYSPVLEMHDLLYDMALGPVRSQESRPRSRLTIFEDIEDLLIQNTEMEAVESIDLDLCKSNAVEINTEAFVSMKKLRLLRIHFNRSIDSVDDYYRSSDEELYQSSDKCKQSVSGDLKFLSQELRCLVWHGCPLKSLPSNFRPKHLVDLDMRCSHIEKLWEGTKRLEKLKFINLSRSPYLKETPDLSKATNLETVNLEGCTSLLEIHSSISNLENLVFLSLKGCEELKNLPSSIGMKSLNTLELSGCSKLEKFPEISVVMKKLPLLSLDKTAIKELPSSIKNLEGLATLSLKDCSKLKSLPSSICQLRSLRYVYLSGCSNLEVFPEISGLKDMEKLRELYLDGTSIKEFSPSTSALIHLAVLSLRGCKVLKSLPSSIEMVSLQSLNLSGCSNLQRFPEISGTMCLLLELHLDDTAIEELPQSINNITCLRSLSLRDCGEITSLPSSIFQLRHLEEIVLSGCAKFGVFPKTVEVHCTKLFTLRIEDCGELKTLPSSFSLLKSLTIVSLSGCSKFEVFPEILEDMEGLRELHLDGTSIKQLFPSIERLKRVMLLSLRNCRSLVILPDNVCNLTELIRLRLSGCSNLHNLPKNLEKLESLQDLEAEGSGLKQPFSLLRLKKSPSSSTNCLVGVDRHINHMQLLLCPLQVNDYRIVEIWGMCGIGKTTITRAVYETIANEFEYHCFLEDVKEGFRKHGALFMQEELLSRILKEKVQNVGSLDKALNMIQNRLGKKKFLLVLDDVDSKDQIETLLGKQQPFGSGSRVIVTTRNENILRDGILTTRNKKVEPEKYCPKLLDDEALEIFRHYAFRTTEPSTEYNSLLRSATEYAQGLPLALKVLGSFLFGKSKSEWEAALASLSSREVESVFNGSFRGLHDLEKKIFLDVACFFKGMEKDRVAEILHSCGLSYGGLTVLIDRSLIDISDRDGTLKMFDLIEKVGREESLLASLHDPGERSRLWTYEGIQCLSTENMVTGTVEAINLDLSKERMICFRAKAFDTMVKLRLLQIYDNGSNNCKQHVVGDFGFISHELRSLIWHRYPLKSLPSNFHPKNLVDLDMRFSRLEQLRNETKLLENLKFINLSHCTDLKNTPDLTEATSLKKLTLEGCTSLFDVHPSVFDLESLVFLSLKDCRKLKILRSSIHMKSLKTLQLSGCSSLQKFPEISEVMTELSELGLDETAIKELPSSIVRLKGLNVLSIRDCTNLEALPDSICNLAHLTFLNLPGCSNLSDYPDRLRSMQSLTIGGIEQLPVSKRTKQTEKEGVTIVSGEGNSSGSGQGTQGRVYNRYHKYLSPVPDQHSEKREERDDSGGRRQGRGLSQLLEFL